MKTIAKSRLPLIETIFAGAKDVRCFAFSNAFSGSECSADVARRALNIKGAKLVARGDGKYTIHVHSNLSYEFTSTV